MTQRPEQIQRRLHGLEEIGDVVGALRAISAGHASSAQGAMYAISAYTQTVTQALTAALAAAAPPAQPEGPGLMLVVGAAQGFCGAYPTRILEAVQASAEPGTGLLVVGHRSVEMLKLASLPAIWSEDLPGNPSAIPALASRATDALLELSAHHPGPIRALTGAAHSGHAPVTRTLFPPPAPEGPIPQVLPVMTLPASALLSGLLQEALFAAVAHVMMEGAAAEAQARVEAMARAQNNLRTRRTEIQQQYQQARQEQMTTEMIELSSVRPTRWK